MRQAHGRQNSRTASSQSKLLLFSLCAFLLLTCFAPAAGGATWVTFSSAAQQSRPSSRHDSLGQQLVRETREAAGEDDESKFKHSWSVEKLSKYTHLSVDQMYRVSIFLNFVGIGLLAIAFYKRGIPTLIPPPGPYMRQRSAMIVQAMEEARKASEDANRRLAEIEARLSKLDAEIAGMRAQAEEEAVAEEHRIKAAAEEDARKIIESAQQEIAAAAKSARRELKEYAANLAVSLAKKQIHVDAPTDHALLSYFAQQLSASDGGTRKGGQ